MAVVVAVVVGGLVFVGFFVVVVGIAAVAAVVAVAVVRLPRGSPYASSY